MSAAGGLVLWFLVAGFCGATALAIQQAFRQPRPLAPLFAVGVFLLVGAIAWIVTSLLDPGGYLLYTLAVLGPFALVTVFVLTLIVVLIPTRFWKPVGIIAAISAFIVTAVSFVL